MLDEFTGRTVGDHAFIECLLATDLTSGYEHEPIPAHKQVDVKLPNGKLLRLPYAWLREDPGILDGGVDEPMDAPSKVLDGMLDASGPPKRVVKRASPSQ